MFLQLEILDGAMRGEQFSFDLIEGQEVRVGRDGEVCEVHLTEDYARVSRQHCALRAVLGRIRIRTNKQNAVLVGKEPVFDDTVLDDGAVMRLGHGGPRVRVGVRHRRADDAPASTLMVKPGAGAPELQLREQAAAVQSELGAARRRSRLTAAALAAVALLGLFLAVQARADAAVLEQGALDPDQAALVAAMLAEREQSPPDLGETAARTARSVYCVMRTNPGGAAAVGTAWVVDRDAGLLATNAHVAAEFRPGVTVVRASGAGGRDLRVEAARLHPAYAAFGDQLTRFYKALGTVRQNPAQRVMRGFDVALLVVAEADRAALAPDLPLQGVEAIQGLAAGAACATVGFPAEDIGFNPERPQHKTHLGNVVALTDFFYAAGSPAESQLVHTSMPVAGGASGSPVVDEHGRVIGLISSANFLAAKNGRRIPLIGTTYAQRVDTLHELLDGRAMQRDRDATWMGAFEVAAENAQKTIEQLISDEFADRVAGEGAPATVEVVSREVVELRWDAERQRSIATLQVEAKESGQYLCCVTSEELLDIDLVALLPTGGVVADDAEDWYPAVVFEVEAGEVVKLFAYRTEQQDSRAAVTLLRSSR